MGKELTAWEKETTDEILKILKERGVATNAYLSIRLGSYMEDDTHVQTALEYLEKESKIQALYPEGVRRRTAQRSETFYVLSSVIEESIFPNDDEPDNVFQFVPRS